MPVQHNGTLWSHRPIKLLQPKKINFLSQPNENKFRNKIIYKVITAAECKLNDADNADLNSR